MYSLYKDDELGIYFSQKPEIIIRYSNIENLKEQNKQICTKPFLLKNEIKVVLEDFLNEKIYEFDVPKNYCWDGASIPTLFYRVIGVNSDPRFLIPSLVHDVLCENHEFVNYDRYFSTRVFERLLYVSGVGAFKRWIMFHSVDNYQKLCKWKDK